MKTVFILGAGASRQAGGPLMNDFIDKAEELLLTQRAGGTGGEKALRIVLDAINELQSVHSKSYLDLDNIETLFSSVEMAQIIGRLGTWQTRKIKKLREAIITIIVKTLENSIPFPVREGLIYPAPPYGDLINIIEEIQSEPDRHSISFITFN